MIVPYVEEVENFEQKCPVIFVIDRSGSMQGPSIEEVNNGLNEFLKGIVRDSITKSRLDLAIISYDNNITIERDFSLLDKDTKMPVLEAGGLTYTGEALEKAIDLIEKRKDYYKQVGLTYYRPYIILLTDGYASDTDRIYNTAKKIQNGIINKKFNFWGFGVADANMEELHMLAGNKAIIQKIKNIDNLSTFFEWLSGSFGQVSHSRQGDIIDMTPEVGQNPFMQTIE
jgi:uncharacterized protein YegL